MTQNLVRRYIKGNMDVAEALIEVTKQVQRTRKELEVLQGVKKDLEQADTSSKFIDMTPAHAEAVRAVISQNGNRLRLSDQAKAWAGYAIADALGVKADTRLDKMRVMEMIDTLIAQDVLKVESVYDGRQGRYTPRIVVASGSDQ